MNENEMKNATIADIDEVTTLLPLRRTLLRPLRSPLRKAKPIPLR